MLRMKDVMKLFGISRPTVYKWMKQGLPFNKVGKLIFFDSDQVVMWVQEHGVGATE